MCSLYEARAKSVQEYNFEQHQCLKEGFLEVHPACAFAKIQTTDPPTQYLATPFGNVPMGCVLSYQALEYDKQHVNRESPSHPFPALPLSITENAPCVSEEEHAQLSRMNMTLDEAHILNKVLAISQVKGMTGWKGHCITFW